MIGPYLVDNATLTMHKGADKWQTPLATEDVALRVRVDYKERLIQNAAGQMVVSMAKVLMRPRTIIMSGYSTRAANTISYKDKIVFDGIEHGIMKISKSRDFSVRSMDVYVT